MITITDIAAKAGVSRATVSYVLNEHNTSVRISDATRQRVLEAAETLGYRRNELARAMITGKNRMLGFWVMHANREPVVRVLSGAMKEADENGYFIQMLGFENSTLDHRIVERCIEWRLSGIIAIHAPSITVEAVRAQLTRSEIPIVIVDSQQPPQGMAHITSDAASGVREVITHLVGLGHRDIAFIAGEPGPDDTVSHERVAAYRQAMREHKLTRHIRVEHGYWIAEATERMAREILNSSKRPTAIACASDHMAMTVVRAAAQLRLCVPQDLSVTGFDDLTAAALYNPPLTTVSQSFEEMGRAGVRHLLESAKGNRAVDAPEQRIATRLVLRESTAPAPR
jgi:LacI family transcriptional regulator